MFSKKKSAFTLIELMVIISIISILALIVVMQFSGIRLNAAFAKITNDISQGGKAVELYKDSTNEVPMVQNPVIPVLNDGNHGSCDEWPFPAPQTTGLGLSSIANYIINVDVPFTTYSPCTGTLAPHDTGFKNILFTGLPQALQAKIDKTALNNYTYDYITKDCTHSSPPVNGPLIKSHFSDYIVMAEEKDDVSYSGHPAFLWIYDGAFNSGNSYSSIPDLRMPASYKPQTVDPNSCYLDPP